MAIVISKCIECGNDFVKTGNTQIYCDVCRKEGKEMVCKECGRLMFVGVGRKKAICESCRTVKCKECGNEFLRSHNSKYCPDCKTNGVSVRCSNCGETIIVDRKEKHKDRVRCDECKTGICEICGKSFTKFMPRQKRCDECKSWIEDEDFTYSHTVRNGKAITKAKTKDKKKKKEPSLVDIIKFQREHNIPSYGLAVIEWDKLHVAGL